MLNDGTQRHTLTRHQNEEMKVLNISFPRVGMEPVAFSVTLYAPALRLVSFSIKIKKKLRIFVKIITKIRK